MMATPPMASGIYVDREKAVPTRGCVNSKAMASKEYVPYEIFADRANMETQLPSVVIVDKSVGRTSKYLSSGTVVLALDDTSTKFSSRMAVEPTLSDDESFSAENFPSVHQRKLTTKWST